MCNKLNFCDFCSNKKQISLLNTYFWIIDKNRCVIVSFHCSNMNIEEIGSVLFRYKITCIAIRPACELKRIDFMVVTIHNRENGKRYKATLGE